MVVHVLPAAAATGGDGRPTCLVLGHAPATDGPGWTTCDVAALRSLVAGADVPPLVALLPQGLAPAVLDALVERATLLLADPAVAAVAAFAPVTDAVKRVAGSRLVETLDRSTLRLVPGPGVVRTAALRAALAAATGTTIAPLPAAARAAAAGVPTGGAA